MSRELRDVTLGLVAIAAIIASTFVLDWYVVKLTGAPMAIGEVTVDLREVRACSVMGPCGVVPLSASGGSYPTAAWITFWTSLAFGALVAYQVGMRMIYGATMAPIQKGAHGLGAVVFLGTIVAGYIVGLDLGREVEFQGISMSAERGWGAIVMLVGVVAGNLALVFAAREDEAVVEAPVAAQPYVPLAERQRRATQQPPIAAPAPERAKAATTPPPGLHGTIRFAVLAGEVTRAGIDARRADGPVILVLWRDVVGIVARRLPPALGGAPFVDIVSTAGATLRILPWTKLTGDTIPGESDDARVRALVTLLAQRCPEAQLDAATRTYLAGAEPAPQLPDAETLAAHDQRLA